MYLIKNKENDIYFCILIQLEDGTEKLIGNCGIHDINWKNRFGVIGIAIGEKDYQNKGYGSEAIEILLEYGFNKINLNRIELLVYDYNVRALKSYKKIGFIEEGRKRKFMWYKGAYHDAIIMSILAEEWNAKE